MPENSSTNQWEKNSKENSWCHSKKRVRLKKRMMLKHQLKSWCCKFWLIWLYCYMKSLFWFYFFFLQIHNLLLQYIKLPGHVFTVALSFTNITEVGKGVFICPLLEAHSKNTALPALSYLLSAKWFLLHTQTNFIMDSAFTRRLDFV